MSAFVIVPIEHNIKQAITAAVKAVEYKRYNVEPDEVVDNLLKDIFKSLFPHSPNLVEDVERIQIPIVPPPAPEPEPEQAPAAPEKKKRASKKEKKEDQNLSKLNPSQKKVLKNSTPEVDQKEFLEYVNSLPAKDYQEATFEQHVQNYVKSKEPKEDTIEKAMREVQFNGKTYYVDVETNKVYEEDGDVDKLVGHVGMAQFERMEM